MNFSEKRAILLRSSQRWQKIEQKSLKTGKNFIANFSPNKKQISKNVIFSCFGPKATFLRNKKNLDLVGMNFTPQNILSQRYLDRKGLKPSILWIHFEIDLVQVKGSEVPEVESSRTSLASRTSSKTHFEVLGLEGQVLGLGLEASSPRKLPCPRLEDSTIF